MRRLGLVRGFLLTILYCISIMNMMKRRAEMSGRIMTDWVGMIAFMVLILFFIVLILLSTLSISY